MGITSELRERRARENASQKQNKTETKSTTSAGITSQIRAERAERQARQNAAAAITEDALRTVATEMAAPEPVSAEPARQRKSLAMPTDYAHAENSLTRRAAHYADTANRLRDLATETKQNVPLTQRLGEFMVNRAAENVGIDYTTTGEKARDINRRASVYDDLSKAAYDKYYHDIRNRDDFAEKSVAGESKSGGRMSGGYYDDQGNLRNLMTEDIMGDARYDFINNINGYREQVRQYQNAQDQDASVGTETRMGKADPYSVFSPYIFMRDDEIATYNYLYETEGKDSADKYIDRLTPELNGRWRTAQEGRMALFAAQDPVGASAYSVAMSPTRSLNYLGQVRDLIDDGEIDQNARYNRFSYSNTAIRSKVSDTVEKNYGKVGSFAYNLGMSMMDSAVNTIPTIVATGGASAAAPVVEWVMLGIMGSGVAADTVVSMKDQGASDAKAFILGTAAGAVEAITEKIGVDNFLESVTKGMSGKNIVSALLQLAAQNGGSEAAEEGLADVFNWFADDIYAVISGGESEFTELVDYYKSQGMTDGQAVGEAFKDRAKEISLDTIGGGISGLLFGGGALVANLVAGRTSGQQNGITPEQALLSIAAQQMRGADFDRAARSFAPTEQTQETAPRNVPEGMTAEQATMYDAAQRMREADYRQTEDALQRTAAEMYDVEEETAQPSVEAQERTESEAPTTTTTQSEKPQATYATAREYIENQRVGESGMEVFDSLGEDVSLDTAAAFDTYYRAGRRNTPIQNVETSLSSDLTLEQQQMAWNAGRQDWLSRKGGIDRTSEGYKAAKLTNREEQNIDALGKVLRRPIQFVNSIETTNQNGDRIQADARILPDGTIEINANTKKPYQTLAIHETVHRIAAVSPEVYKDMEKFVRANMRAGAWAINADIRSENYAAEDIAEEIIADGFGRMLRDADLANEFAMDNRTAWQKFVDTLKDILEEIRRFITGNKNKLTHDELLAYNDLEGQVNDMLSQFVQAAEQASDETADINKPVNANVETKFSRRYDGEYMDAAEKANKKTGNVTETVLATARAAREKVKGYLDKISDMLPTDIEGNTFYSDSSYGGSQENTTECVRSISFDELMDTVAEQLGRPLTVEETVLIAQEAMALTDKPECLYCYVAMDRKAYREFLGKYLEQRDAFLADVKSGMEVGLVAPVKKSAAKAGGVSRKIPTDTAYGKMLNGRDNTASMYNRAKLWLESDTLITAKNLASMASMNRAAENPALRAQIDDAQAYAQSASWAKKRVGFLAYNNHILKWGARKINKLNKLYGMRMYSFSDFSPAFILENMQMITDAAVKGLKTLAYTKELDFVRIFAPTGMNINISVFGYNDGKGGVAMDAMQGADWAQAQALRSQYKNVGCTFVATNDTQVEWALAQDWIDVVIPFHLVRTGANVAKMFGWTNYTQMSADMKNPDATVKGKQHIYPYEHQNDKATFLRLCEEKGLIPRFEKWVNNPNYMKLVNETRQSEGETQTVQPVFNTEVAKAAIDEMVKRGGYMQHIGGTRENMEYIAEEIAGKIQSKEKAPKNSVAQRELTAEDREYLKAVQSGENWKAEKIIRDGALKWGAATNENGKPLDLYHGTPRFGFTEFSSDASRDGLIYTSTRSEVSANYAGRDRYASVREIGKPFIENATSVKDIIQNAKTVYGADYSIMDSKTREKEKAEIEAMADKMADRINALPDHSSLYRYDDEDYSFNNALSMVEDPFFIINGRDYESYTADEYRQYLAYDIERFNDNLEKVREYMVEHEEEFRESNPEAYKLLVGHDLFDAYVDIAYRYMKLISDDTLLITKDTGHIERPNELQDAMERARYIGAYHLYGNLGEKPLIIDAKGRDWLAVEAPSEITGDNTWHSTDFIANKARDAGYTSVVFKNVYDGGMRADDYVFFNPTQLKSADEVTYDDDGEIVPPSERFNPEKKDIRYSTSQRELTKEDRAYLKAVQSGDMETAQRVVNEAAKKAGYTVKAWHQTAGEFTEFNTDNPSAGKYDSETPNGIFFKTNDHDIGLEGKRQIAAFINPGRMLDFKNREEANAWYRKNVNGYRELQNEMKEALKPYEDEMDNLESKMFAAESGSAEEDALEKQWDGVLAKMTNVENDYRGRLRSLLDDYFLNGESGYDSIHFDYDGHRYVNGKRENVETYIVFSNTQVKSADTITYDDEGNVIPPSKRFDPNNPDIRFSNAERKLTSKEREYLSGRALLRQNERLKERVEYLKGQMKTTTVPALRKSDVDKIAGAVLKDYESTADKAEISSAMKELGDFILNSDKTSDAVFSEGKVKATDIAKDIVGKARAITEGSDVDAYDTVKTMLKRPMIISERDSHNVAPDGWGKWRNANKGIVNVSINGKGIPVETAYHELSEAYPWLFPETVTSQADMVKQMVNALHTLEPVFENPYSTDMADAVEYCANEILGKLLTEARPNPPTFADKAQTRLDAEKARGRERMEKLREQKDEEFRKLWEADKYEIGKAMARERRKREESISALKKRFAEQKSEGSERRTAGAMRVRIAKHAKKLSTELLKPNDKHHIPEELRGAVAKLLESINLESGFDVATDADGSGRRVERGEGTPTKRTEAFAALRKAYQDIGDGLVLDPDLFGDAETPGLLGEVVAMADKPLANMTVGELETVWKTLRAVEGSIRTWNKLFAIGRWETVSDIAESLREDNKGKRTKVELRSVLGKGQNLLSLDMLTPETYFGYFGRTGRSMFRTLRNAQDEQIRLWDEAVKFTENAAGNYDVRKAEKETVKIKIGGEEVECTRAQLMELYALMRREQALEHLKGGVQFAPVQKGIRKITMADAVRLNTLEDLAEATEQLTPEEKRIAESLQDFLSRTASEWGNRASMAVYGYKKFGEQNYWPIKVNRHDVKSTIEGETGQRSVRNYGMAQATKPHANNSIVINSIFDTFANHVAEMATYSAFLEASEDLMRVFNYQFRNESGERTGTVKGEVNKIHGTGGSRYFTNLMTQLAYGVKGENIGTEYMGGLVGNYKGSSIGANLRVFVQQPTAIVRAAEMINPAYLTAGLKNPFAGWKKALKYAPIAQWKDWGYFDMAAGRSLKSLMFNADSKLQKANSALMAPAGVMDSFAWGQLWNACELEQKAKGNLKPGTEEFYKAVAERFTEVIDHTQVVDGILQRSQIMRSADGVAKMATSFMAEPTKQYNELVSAIYEVRNAQETPQRNKAVKRLARTTASLVVASALNAVVKSIVDALRDDDRDKKYWERFLSKIPENLKDEANPFSYIPYVRDISSLIQGYSIDRMDMETIGNVVSASKTLIKALRGDSTKTVGNAMSALISEAARMLGVPAANIKRDLLGIANTIGVETDNWMFLYGMDKLLYSTNAASRYYDTLWAAYKSGSDQYEELYEMMIRDGFDEDKIRKAMDSHMKEDQGVSKVSDLDNRFLPPDQQASYDKAYGELESSGMMSKATGDQQKKAEDLLYKMVTGSESSDAKSAREKVEEGSSIGISDADYILYKLALTMVDEPNSNGNLGTATKEEREAASLLVPGLSENEREYLAGLGMNPWK